MGMRRAIIEGLNTSTAYYFHIKLTRDARHKVVVMIQGLGRNLLIIWTISGVS